jgi:hypothetical protein
LGCEIIHRAITGNAKKAKERLRFPTATTPPGQEGHAEFIRGHSCAATRLSSNHSCPQEGRGRASDSLSTNQQHGAAHGDRSGLSYGSCCERHQVSLAVTKAGTSISVRKIAKTRLTIIAGESGRGYLWVDRISFAARIPLAIAPCTVPVLPPMSVASPAKNNVFCTSSARVAGLSLPPTLT